MSISGYNAGGATADSAVTADYQDHEVRGEPANGLHENFNQGGAQKRAAQRHGDFETLMREAAEARPLLAQELAALGERFGCDYEVGILKSPRRAASKIENKYNGEVSHLCDICRGMLVVDDHDLETIQNIADYFNPQHNERAKYLDDRLSKPTSTGFRSLNISVEMSNRHVVEIMVLTRGMRQAYDKTHDLYEKATSLTNGFNNAGGGVTPDSVQSRDAMLAEASEIHERATTEALKKFALKIN